MICRHFVEQDPFEELHSFIDNAVVLRKKYARENGSYPHNSLSMSEQLEKILDSVNRRYIHYKECQTFFSELGIRNALAIENYDSLFIIGKAGFQIYKPTFNNSGFHLNGFSKDFNKKEIFEELNSYLNSSEFYKPARLLLIAQWSLFNEVLRLSQH